MNTTHLNPAEGGAWSQDEGVWIEPYPGYVDGHRIPGNHERPRFWRFSPAERERKRLARVRDPNRSIASRLADVVGAGRRPPVGAAAMAAAAAPAGGAQPDFGRHLKPPTFESREKNGDPMSFLLKLAVHLGSPANLDMSDALGRFLTGPAFDWWVVQRDNGVPVTWEQMADDFVKAFRGYNYGEMVQEQISNLRQGPYESVDQYHRRFQHLNHQHPTADMTARWISFRDGLRPELHVQAAMLMSSIPSGGSMDPVLASLRSYENALAKRYPQDFPAIANAVTGAYPGGGQPTEGHSTVVSSQSVTSTTEQQRQWAMQMELAQLKEQVRQMHLQQQQQQQQPVASGGIHPRPAAVYQATTAEPAAEASLSATDLRTLIQQGVITAMSSYAQQNPTPARSYGGGGGRGGDDRRCYGCNRTGHIRRFCPDERGRDRDRGSGRDGGGNGRRTRSNSRDAGHRSSSGGGGTNDQRSN